MPPEKEPIRARELLTLLLDDEEFNSNMGPRRIIGFDQLLEKMDKLCDAITHGRSNGEDYEGGMEGGGYEGDGQHSEQMSALIENLQALRAVIERPAAPNEQSEEMGTLLTVIAKNTMRQQRTWEFDIQRDRRTGFTEKIIARPVGN